MIDVRKPGPGRLVPLTVYFKIDRIRGRKPRKRSRRIDPTSDRAQDAEGEIVQTALDQVVGCHPPMASWSFQIEGSPWSP